MSQQTCFILIPPNFVHPENQLNQNQCSRSTLILPHSNLKTNIIWISRHPSPPPTHHSRTPPRRFISQNKKKDAARSPASLDQRRRCPDPASLLPSPCSPPHAVQGSYVLFLAVAVQGSYVLFVDALLADVAVKGATPLPLPYRCFFAASKGNTPRARLPWSGNVHHWLRSGDGIYSTY